MQTAVASAAADAPPEMVLLLQDVEDHTQEVRHDAEEEDREVMCCGIAFDCGAGCYW